MNDAEWGLLALVEPESKLWEDVIWFRPRSWGGQVRIEPDLHLYAAAWPDRPDYLARVGATGDFAKLIQSGLKADDKLSW